MDDVEDDADGEVAVEEGEIVDEGADEADSDSTKK